ncbi:MAG: hypothetical protein GY697_01385, partial [Desulfobacterales bacterium]|nr:hypothetical protein [Desulfobacterales bacterium]
MTDKDPDVTGGNADDDGGDATTPPKEEPESISDIRSQVDQNLEGIFGDLDDDDDEEATAGRRIEIFRGKPAPAPVTDIAPDTLSLDVDTPDAPMEAIAPDSPAGRGEPEADAVAPPPPDNEALQAVKTGSGQAAHTDDEAMADRDLEVTGEDDTRDDGGITPPLEKEPEPVSDAQEADSPAKDADFGNNDNDDDGDNGDMVAEMPGPASAAIETPPDAPSPDVDLPAPQTEAVKPARPAETRDKLDEDTVLSPAPEYEAHPAEVDIPAPPSAERKPRKPLTSRILVWGAVLIIITVTVRYFVTYDAEQLAQAPVADSGQLFHKIA